MRKATTRLAIIGMCAALSLGVAPAVQAMSTTAVPAPDSVPSLGCPIGFPAGPAELQRLFAAPASPVTKWSDERCGRPGPGNDDYGLGSLMWYGPDWGDPSIGTFA